MGGLTQSAISQANRINAAKVENKINAANSSNIGNAENTANSSNTGNIGNTENTANIGDSVNKFIDSYFDSPLESILFSMQGILYIIMTIVLIHIIQLIVRLHINSDASISWLHPKINHYINKIIYLNRKVNVLWLWLGIILIFVGVFISFYLSYELYSKIDAYVEFHNRVRGN